MDTSSHDQDSISIRSKSANSSLSTSSSNYDAYLRLATEKNPVMLLELDQDGTIRYLSELWEEIVGPRNSSQIADLIIGSQEDKYVFHRAMEMMMVNDDVSYTVTFNVLSTKPTNEMEAKSDNTYDVSAADNDDDNDNESRNKSTKNSSDNDKDGIDEQEIITLEACGILMHDNVTQLATHSMWTVKPYNSALMSNDLHAMLPPDFVKRLGFGATIFAEFLKSIEFEQIVDERELPTPKMELCRVCETFVPAWWLETHSQNCVFEHRIDSLVHLLHDNLVEQLTLLQNEPITEYKTLTLKAQSPSSERVIDSLKELCDIAININPSEIRLTNDPGSSMEDILMNPVSLTQGNERNLYDFSPRTKWNIENVQSWQLTMKEEMEQDAGLSQLAHDTIDLAKKKVDAVLRLDNAMTYSMKIKNEVNNWVLQLILRQIENNRINMPLAMDYRSLASLSPNISPSDGFATPVEDKQELPAAATLTSGNAVNNKINYVRSVNASTSSITNTKIASPQPHRAQNDIFANSYLVNDSIPEPKRESSEQGRLSMDPTSSSSSRSATRPDSKSLSRSLTPKQRVDDDRSTLANSDINNYLKKHMRNASNGEIMEKSDSSGVSLPTIVSTKPHSITNTSSIPKLRSTICLTPGRGSPLPFPLTTTQMSRKNSGSKLNQEKSPVVSPFAAARDFLTPEQHPTLLNLPNQPLSPLLLATNQIKSSTPSIKDYDILKPISKGAYGSVYLARKKITGDYFAIKVLKKSDMIAKNQVTNVKSERAIMMVQSDKPYVARLYASFQNRDNLFLVMEYLPGGDLATLIKMMGYLPEEWTKQYISEVIVGVDDMHQNGITHHDLKPDNLLIDSKGHVKLTDFGLSRAGLVRRHKYLPRSKPLSFSNSNGKQSPGSPSEVRFSNGSISTHNNSNNNSIASPKIRSNSNNNLTLHKRGNSLQQEITESQNATMMDGAMHESVRQDSASSSHSNMDISALQRSDSQLSFSILNISRSSTPTPPILNVFHARTNSNTSDIISDTGTMDLALFHPEDSRQEKSFFGTPDYLAPETIEGTGEDAQCDWWSVGCILFELLIGYPPFHASTPEEVFKKIISGAIQWPEFSTVEEEKELEASHAKDLIIKLLVVDPSKRLGFNGAQEIKDHPYFKDVDWDRVYEEEASFVPAVEHPEDTDYFDLRGAELEDFGGDEESDPCGEDVPDMYASSGFTPLLNSEDTTKRLPGSSAGSYHESNLHTPVSKLSISSVLESVSRENSNRSSPTIKHFPLAIPPHMRDRRVSKLNDSQTEFGSFYFRNLSTLDKANKDAINRLKSEHLTDNPNVHRRTSSASHLSSSSESSSSKIRTGKVSVSGSPGGSTVGKPAGLSDSPSLRTSSPDRSTSMETGPLSRKGSGDNTHSPASSCPLQFNDDSPTGTKLKSPLSPSNLTSPSTFPPSFSSNGPQRTRMMQKSSSQRSSSNDFSADENDRLLAISKVNSLRYRRRSGRKSSTGSEVGCHMDVLLCEPIPIHRYRFSKDLESLGCTVVSVGAGDELVSRATSGIKFDLIITALKLPKLGAVDIVRLLKHTNSVNCTTPVVAVTNYYQEAIGGNVFNDVLEKPVAYDHLRKVLAKYTLEKIQQQEDTIVSDSDF